MSTKQEIDFEEENIWTNPDFDLVQEPKKPNHKLWWVVKLPKGKARYGTSSYPSVCNNSLLED